jgi:phosphate:Na+ symporter
MLPIVWLGWFPEIVKWITPFGLSQETIMPHIAVAHTLFNVFNTIIFLPIVGWLEFVVLKILPVTKNELFQQPVVLERHLLSTPELALEQGRREMVRMAQRAKEAVNFAVEGLIGDDRRCLDTARSIEDVIDHFQYEITSYLAALSTKELSDEISTQIPVLLHTINDLERAGDHAVNIAEIAERKITQKQSFSEPALGEARQLKEQINEMFDKIIYALDKNDIEAAKSALVNEENLNRMQIDFRRSHVQRMTENICTPETGLIFIDLVDNIEKIGDHLTNIAQGVIGGLQWDGTEAIEKT